MKVLIKKQLSKVLVLGVAFTFIVGSPVFGQSPNSAKPSAMKEPMIQSAIDGIFEAFKTHPLVGISDAHGMAQLMEFYNALIRDPRFAQNVGNVVVEFGGAARQDVIDRYVNGEFVPYKELRQVWTDVVGWIPTVSHLGYVHFFAQVRQTNKELPNEKRIRVWLGEPPIIWAKVKTREDYYKFMYRDEHAAKVIIKNILKQNKKALVIYGGFHFESITEEERRLREEWSKADPKNAGPVSSLGDRIRAKYPDAFFIVETYYGWFGDKSCTNRFEEAIGMESWQMPVLVTQASGTALESEALKCPPPIPQPIPIQGSGQYPPTMPKALQDIERDRLEAYAKNRLFFSGSNDAVLFLGPAESLTLSPRIPDLYLDEEYRKEIDRHIKIMGDSYPPGWTGNVPAVTPMSYRSRIDSLYKGQ